MERLARLAGFEPATYGLEVRSPNPLNRKLSVFLAFCYPEGLLRALNKIECGDLVKKTFEQVDGEIAVVHIMPNIFND